MSQIHLHTDVFFSLVIFYDGEPRLKNWENTHKDPDSSVSLQF